MVHISVTESGALSIAVDKVEGHHRLTPGRQQPPDEQPGSSTATAAPERIRRRGAPTGDARSEHVVRPALVEEHDGVAISATTLITASV